MTAGFTVKQCCRVLGVTTTGYYQYRKRPMSRLRMRRQWLTALIREVHADIRGTYGSRRVHAELIRGRGIRVSLNFITILMHDAGVAGLSGPAKVKRIKGTPNADGLVRRKFARSKLDELWVTDIAEYPTREVFSCCAPDACSRKVVGWSINSQQDSNLVINTIDMAIGQRRPAAGTITDVDHGVQSTW